MTLTDAIDRRSVESENAPSSQAQLETAEALRFFRTLRESDSRSAALHSVAIFDGQFLEPQHYLQPQKRGEKVKSWDFFGESIVQFGDSAVLQLDGHKRVKGLQTKNGKTEDIDYDGDSRDIENFKRAGTKYYLKEGTFHYKNGDGKEIDTGFSKAFAAADGSFMLQNDKLNVLEIHTRDGGSQTLSGAKASFDKKGNLTVERSDGSREILTPDRTLMEVDRNGRIVEINYPNGDKRSFSYTGDTLSAIKETDGSVYTRRNGKWIAPDGKDAGRSNAFVAADGTYSYVDRDGKIDVFEANGKCRKVDVDDLGKNARVYPDAEKREAENRRISELIEKQGGLTKQGREIIPDLERLGLDETDIFHGSHVVVGGDGHKGDGGELYRKWKEIDGSEGRTSSHESSAKQYQIKVGPGDAVILFGLTPHGNTWFQLERHPGRTGNIAEKGISFAGSFFGNLADGDLSFDNAHDDDFELYQKVRQNIGPFGISPHSDRNPVRVSASG
ncbi:MAG TPA: hypothetical protein V6D17_09270 [Candidatus Obscuribacterales bacterium]